MTSLFFILPVLLKFVTSEESELQLQSKFTTLCTTPNLLKGVCIEVQNCTPFTNAILSGTNYSHAFLQHSRCGPPNENQERPKVCCGVHTDYLDTIPEIGRLSTQSPSTTTVYSTAKIATTPYGNDSPVVEIIRQRPKKGKNPFPTICGNQTLSLPSRIFGGSVASLGEFPWMARLRHRRRDGLLSYGCGGFLITTQFVLTAAHCIASKELQPLGELYEVQLGEHNTENDVDCSGELPREICADIPQIINVAKPIVHPEYTNNKDQHNDIAVIPLLTPAKLSDYVYPICLSARSTQENEMWLSGWGKTEISFQSPVKLKVSVRRGDKAKCVDKYKTLDVRILSSQICAGGEKGRDSCSGDSGGPLMIQEGIGSWYAEGIVSFGLGCGIEGWAGVYTDIPHFKPWIKRTLKRYLRMQEEQSQNNTRLRR